MICALNLTTIKVITFNCSIACERWKIHLKHCILTRLNTNCRLLLLNFCTFVTLFRIKIALLADFWQLSSDAQSATAFAANAFDAASHATFNSIVRRELISMELKCSLSCETASHGLRANHNGVPLLLHSACVCFGICLQKLKCLHLIEARGFLSSLFPNRQIYYHFVPLFAHLFNESCGSPLNSQWTIDNTVL